MNQPQSSVARLESAPLEALLNRIAELEAALGIETQAPTSFVVPERRCNTQKLWQLFCMLIKRPVVTRDAVMIVWYGDADVEDKIIDVCLVPLRRFLLPHGVSIRSRFGVGWYLDCESRPKAAALRDRWLKEDEACIARELNRA